MTARITDERLAYMIERQAQGYLTISTAELALLLTEIHERRRIDAEGPSEAVLAAARDLVASKFETYKAGNYRQVSIQDENGEKCWIVPFDEMFALEAAIIASRRVGE